MSCKYNDGKKKDLDYVRKMATALTYIAKQDVQIFNATRPVIGKIYDFAVFDANRPQVIEVIEFREPESEVVLSDIDGSEPEPVESVEPEVKPKSVRRKVVSDIGDVLPAD